MSFAANAARGAGVVLGLACWVAAQPPRGVQPYVAESKLYALYKPAGWTVKELAEPDAFRIQVNAPDGATGVEFYWARNGTGRAEAVAVLANHKRRLEARCSGVTVSEAYASPDGRRATATIRCRAGAVPLAGRFYYEASAGGVSAQGYLAPEASLASERNTLLNVMASLALYRGSAAGAAPYPVPALAPRRAQDGSLTLRTPADWHFMAAGGKVVTGAPDGAMGFIFTSISGNPMVPNASIAQGVLGVPYQTPPQALALILRAFGHRGIQILGAAPDHATVQECRMALGRNCDAQDIVARWTSSGGAECLGAIKMINTPPSPMGLWFTIMSGIWGPEKEFPRYYPLLAEVGQSFAINDQYARRYIASGLENLRRLQQQTAAAMQDLNRAREQNQAAWEARQARKDYMDSKWDDYRRGNSYWVSELEGGKIYRTDSGGTRDTVTGDYYEGRGYNWVNFEGQNPRHPSETMREVSSYEVEHGGKPPR